MKILHIPYVDSQFCCPTRERIHRFCELNVTDYIINKYKSLEDRGHSIEGALVALLADESLSNGGYEEESILDIVGWYDLKNKKNLSNPFYDGLEETLTAVGRHDIYEKAINAIIDCKGKLENYVNLS